MHLFRRLFDHFISSFRLRIKIRHRHTLTRTRTQSSACPSGFRVWTFQHFRRFTFAGFGCCLPGRAPLTGVFATRLSCSRLDQNRVSTWLSLECNSKIQSRASHRWWMHDSWKTKFIGQGCWTPRSRSQMGSPSLPPCLFYNWWALLPEGRCFGDIRDG